MYYQAVTLCLSIDGQCVGDYPVWEGVLAMGLTYLLLTLSMQVGLPWSGQA